MKWKAILLTFIISSSVPVALIYWHERNQPVAQAAAVPEAAKVPYTLQYTGNRGTDASNFSAAIDATMPAVTYIRVIAKAANKYGNRQVFPVDNNNTDATVRKSGSGVLISEDGYIVTNEHLTSEATSITVTLTNHKSYKATLVGSDKNSDLAVLKIDAKGLPFLLFGNSDKASQGQWVIALGYPLQLGATATVGIIGAKDRTIGVNKGDHPVEGFIQTDAAINTGNSGGALINTSGELIGINSAFLSPNGSYIGYSYAIPVNLAKKVVKQLIKYGKMPEAK